jgi:hypothetical protein
MSTNLAWIAPAAVGAIALAAVLVSRLLRRWRFRHRLRIQTRQLDTFDPATRASAGEAIVGLGLKPRSAHVLLDHLDYEEDERVRLTIALAVANRNDRRASRRRVRTLRAWATAELADRSQPVTRTGGRKRAKKPARISWRAPAAS